LENLLLRPFRLSDAKRVQLLAGDEAIAAGAINIPHPYTDGIAESWINNHQREYEKGNSLILAITIKDKDLLIGSIGLYINKKHQHAELGYWVGKDYWGKGYCSEAVAGVIKYAFCNIALNKIYANFLTRNPASGKVLMKNGFTKEGYFRQHVKYFEKFEDIECFGLLQSEYLKRN
jgi:[ribosomal protein S5]-alanine N-acetyltransferase